MRRLNTFTYIRVHSFCRVVVYVSTYYTYILTDLGLMVDEGLLGIDGNGLLFVPTTAL